MRMGRVGVAAAVLAMVALGASAHGEHPHAHAGAAASPLLGPLECKACEFAVHKLESYLAANATATKVEAAAEGLCAQLMPKKLEECEGLVRMGVKYAVHYIETSLQPHEVCADAGACKATERTAKVGRASADMLDADECGLCEWVASKAKDFVDSKDAQEKVDDLCDKIDEKPQAAACHAFVKKYFPIVKHLLDHMKPEDICSQVHFCHRTDYSGLVEALTARPAAGLKPGCAVCEFAVKEARAKLSDKKIQERIIAGLKGECRSAAPSTKVADGCAALVQEYGPMLLEAAIEKMSPQWCEDLGAC